MSKRRSTVAVEKDGRHHKLFKVWFGGDGSYYVTVPYHTARTASFWKRTVRYHTPFGTQTISTSQELADIAVLDDDDGRIKLSHHPDGFCQFSGHGVLSGKDPNGRIKGIGVLARALPAIGPKFGPVFGVLVYGIEDFDVCSELRPEDVRFKYDDLASAVIPAIPCEPDSTEPAPGLPETEGLSMEGFYFRPEFRRFISRNTDGSMRILMPHPTGIVIPLTVVAAPADCDFPGFLGMYASRQMVRFEAKSGFSINGPAENYREDAFGRQLGDVLSCHYPRMSFVDGRSIRYTSEAPNE